MPFDIEMIRKVYAELPEKIAKARAITGKPLTLAEKVLYTHLHENQVAKPFKRATDYVDFAPDRVAMQDATAQMALLQFMQAGRPKVAVPSTVHCDHLIIAKEGATHPFNFPVRCMPISLGHLSSQGNPAITSQASAPPTPNRNKITLIFSVTLQLL